MHTSTEKIDPYQQAVKDITELCRLQCPIGPVNVECPDCRAYRHRSFNDDEREQFHQLGIDPDEPPEITDPGLLGTTCKQCGRPMPKGCRLCEACKWENDEKVAQDKINRHDPGPDVPYDVRSTFLGLGGIFEAMGKGGHDEL